MADQIVRAFLAIELSERLKSEAQSFLESIQNELTGFRLIPPQNWHLTLHFFGSVELHQLEKVTPQLFDTLSNVKPFSISLAGFGAFPNARKPRIIWIGTGGEIQSLSELKNKLDHTLQKARFEIESRPYHPHITIARIKTGHPVPQFNRPFNGKITDQVCQITLFKSDLASKVPIHTPLQIFPLAF